MFDANVYDYDIKKYNLDHYIISCIQKYYPTVKDLSVLHEDVHPKKIGELVKLVGKDLADTNFYSIFDELVEECILPSLNTEVLIQKFGNIRITIPDQDKTGTVLPYHQGRWVGNGLGLRTIWVPFTDAYSSNSLQIIGIEKSREITKKSTEENWNYERLLNVCIDNSYPVNIKKGQYLLFTQENIHGGVPNRTGKTRISIDVRVLLKNGQPHRKWPGSYFRILGDSKISSRKIKIEDYENVVTYAEYEGFKTKNIDLHFQTLTVKDYCTRMGYIFPHQTGDNEGRNHSYLEYLLKEKNLDHILMFSIYSLPDDYDRRMYLLKLALKNNCKLHFANEEFVLYDESILHKIEHLRSFTSDWSNPSYEH